MRNHRKAWAGAGAVLLALVVGHAIDSGGTAPPDKPASASAQVQTGPAADVTIDKFTVGAFGDVTVPVTVVNHSSKTSNYMVELEIDDAAGTKIGDGIAGTDNLAPDHKAVLSGIALSVNGTPATVKVVKVTRYAS